MKTDQRLPDSKHFRLEKPVFSFVFSSLMANSFDYTVFGYFSESQLDLF